MKLFHKKSVRGGGANKSNLASRFFDFFIRSPKQGKTSLSDTYFSSATFVNPWCRSKAGRASFLPPRSRLLGRVDRKIGVVLSVLALALVPVALTLASLDSNTKDSSAGSMTVEAAFAAAGKSKSGSYYTMQDMESAICDNIATNETGQLVDIRDSKTYYIAKLADGKCWMTQNLDLNLSTATALTNANTDLNSKTSYTPNKTTRTISGTGDTWSGSQSYQNSYDPGDCYMTGGKTSWNSGTATAPVCATTSGDAHYHIGNYYKFSAASAGTFTNTSTGVTANSICPKGWKLPAGSSSSSTANDYSRMLYAQGIIASATATGSSDTNLLITPLFYTRGGRYHYSSGFSDIGSYGYFWSSLKTGSYAVNHLKFGASTVSAFQTGTMDTDYYGAQIRCVARASQTFTLNYNANNGSGAPAAQTAVGDDSATFTISSTVPTRSGYTFAGWATTSSASSGTYKSGNSFTASNTTTTLYAVWAKNTLNLNLAAGSTCSSASLPTTSVALRSGYPTVSSTPQYSWTIPSTTPTCSGKTFLGWATTSSATVAAYAGGSNYTLSGTYQSSDKAVYPTSNMTLYAVFVNNYVLNYDANSGSGAPESQTAAPAVSSMKPTTATFAISSTIPSAPGGGASTVSLSAPSVINNPAAEASPNGTFSTYKSPTGITASTNSSTGYTLSFSATGADRNLTNTTDSTKYLASLATDTTAANFAQDTSIMNRWGISLNNNLYMSVSASDDVALATTMAASTDSYDFYIGTKADLSIPSGSYTNDDTFAFTLVAHPSGPDYEFLGWDTNATAATASYAYSGGAFSPASVISSTATTTLYAVWGASYSITYNLNGGSGTTPSPQSSTTTGKLAYVTITDSQPTGPAAKPYFVGWSKSPTTAEADVEYKAKKSYPVSEFYGGTTLYAIYSDQVQTLYMQNVSDWGSSLALGESVQAVDERDDKTYWITRLCTAGTIAGTCTGSNLWMTQNLDFIIDPNTTLTPSDTNVSENWTPATTADTKNTTTTTVSGWNSSYTTPASARFSSNGQDSGEPGYYVTSGSSSKDTAYSTLAECTTAGNSEELCQHSSRGTYYNWTAAVAMNDSSSKTSGDATTSICPAGWTLPTYSGTTSFKAIYDAYGITSSQAGSIAMRASPLSFVRAGDVSSGSLYGLGSNGYYWSRTVINGNYAYDLSFNGSGVNPQSSSNRGNGFSVRCIAL